MTTTNKLGITPGDFQTGFTNINFDYEEASVAELEAFIIELNSIPKQDGPVTRSLKRAKRELERRNASD